MTWKMMVQMPGHVTLVTSLAYDGLCFRQQAADVEQVCHNGSKSLPLIFLILRVTFCMQHMARD